MYVVYVKKCQICGVFHVVYCTCKRVIYLCCLCFNNGLKLCSNFDRYQAESGCNNGQEIELKCAKSG